MEIIENDLAILSRELTSRLDKIQIQQVMRLLKDLGVKLMTPFDLIHNNIIPIFKTGKWKVSNQCGFTHHDKKTFRKLLF